MKEIRNVFERISELTDFLEHAKNIQKVYVENLGMFIKVDNTQKIERTKKNIFFNNKAQHRIKKAIRKKLHEYYELIND